MPLILIDTNILVYTCDPAEETRQQQAIRLMKALELTGNGRLSVQCLAEFFNATTRGVRPLYTRAEAALQTERLVQIYPVFNLTTLVMLEAARGARDYLLSYYDAQIWAAAKLNQVPVVFSEDFSNGTVLEGVRFVNPFRSAFVLADWI